MTRTTMYFSRSLGACCLALLLGSAATAQANSTPATGAAAATSTARKPHLSTQSPFAASLNSVHASNYYLLHWGVDSMVVKSVPADQLIRFSYRVVDPAKAKVLNTKEAAPQLNDENTRVSLVVPTMDKVGQLRQTGAPESGKTYWMVFSNKNNIVKRGSRVAVVIGDFKVNGLAVE
jgi:hypothetical protein